MREPSPYFIRRVAPELEVEATEISSVYPPEEDGQLNLRKYWRTARKHSRLIASCVAAALVLAALHAFMTSPLYTAETTIFIKPTTPQLLDTREQKPEDLLPDANYFKTQYEILRSRSLAQSVIDAAGLDRNPVFTGANAKRGAIDKLMTGARGWWGRLEASVSKMGAVYPAAGRPQVHNWLVDAYLAGLRILPIPDTDLVRIVFTSSDPQLAASLANEHASAYIRQGISLHSQANEEAEKFLQQRLVELKDELERSEVALNDYRKQKGIVPGLMSVDGKETVVLDRLANLSKELTDSQVDRLSLEAQASLIRKGQNQSLPAVLASASIKTLQGQLDDLNREYASMTSQFTADYPPVEKLRAKIDQTSGQLDQEIQTVVNGIKASYRAALGKEQRLQAELDKEKLLALSINDSAVRYAILQREVDSNRQLYNGVLQRMKDVGLAAETPISAVSIIDRAEAPQVPSEPKKARELLEGLVGGLMGGLMLAFLLEYLDSTLKNSEEVEKYLGLPNLGLIPDFTRIGARDARFGKLPARKAPKELMAAKGELVTSWGRYSPVGEAFRTLRTALLLSRAGSPPKTTLFTSATESEGKTVSAGNAAIMFAHTGAKVLLIDADLRRPRCHKVFGLDNRFGLADILAGTNGHHEMIRSTAIDGLFLLSSGSIPPNPTELLGSRRMRELLSELMTQYEYILIDSPPLMAVSDAVLLSTIVDGVVVVVDSSRTAKQLVRTACSRIEYARAKIFGIVLNKVDFRSSDYNYYQHYNHYTIAPRSKSEEPSEIAPASGPRMAG